MPILTICGLDESEAELEMVKNKLREAVLGIETLGLTAEQVSVFFPTDKIERSFCREIIVFVDGLFEKPERTQEVRNELAEKIGGILHQRFPNDLIEVFVRSFNPAQGFWTSGK